MRIKLQVENIDTISKNAVDTLKGGFVVIAPFDTVYGIICDPFSEQAVKRLFEMKNRPDTKTLGLAINTIDAVSKYAEILPEYVQMINEMTPGKYTFIVPAIEGTNLSPMCIKNGNIAIRIPNSDLINSISSEFGGIIGQTSANLSGRENCYSADQVFDQLGQNLSDEDMVIDGGEIVMSPPSEIWNLTGGEPYKIER